MLPWHDLLRVIILGLFGVAASNYFYYLAIQRTNVATAIIVQYTAPIWVLLYMVARGFERATLSKIASVFLAITGIALVIGLFGQGRLHIDGLGLAAAVIASFSFTFYNIGGHYLLARYDRWTVLLYTTLAASLFWIVVNPPNKILAAHYSASTWLFLAGETWTPPAISRGLLYVCQNSQDMASKVEPRIICYDMRENP